MIFEINVNILSLIKKRLYNFKVMTDILKLEVVYVSLQRYEVAQEELCKT